jgi:hypothetical protein
MEILQDFLFGTGDVYYAFLGGILGGIGKIVGGIPGVGGLLKKIPVVGGLFGDSSNEDIVATLSKILQGAGGAVSGINAYKDTKRAKELIDENLANVRDYAGRSDRQSAFMGDLASDFRDPTNPFTPGQVRLPPGLFGDASVGRLVRDNRGSGSSAAPGHEGALRDMLDRNNAWGAIGAAGSGGGGGGGSPWSMTGGVNPFEYSVPPPPKPGTREHEKQQEQLAYLRNNSNGGFLSRMRELANQQYSGGVATRDGGVAVSGRRRRS